MPRKTSANAGFAIGMVLLVILLIAAVTSFIAKTTGHFDSGNEIGRIDVMNFRNSAADLYGGIRRIATSCTVVDNGANQGQRATELYFNNCIREIRGSLQQTEPNCEKTDDDRRCPYNSLYGGATRTLLPLKMFVPANVKEKWDLAYGVRSPSDTSEKIDIVLFINKINEKACRTLEQAILNRNDVTVSMGNQLKFESTDQDLPVPRKEACIKYNASDYQYFLVIGSFYE
ncbi:MAG: hypothetical protein EYC62_07445 [Alphaproteobacteria bacterium]|nr:MAG: hypothetical protein EYC62_07445 [Alphaproteobacteria bacterium]